MNWPLSKMNDVPTLMERCCDVIGENTDCFSQEDILCLPGNVLEVLKWHLGDFCLHKLSEPLNRKGISTEDVWRGRIMRYRKRLQAYCDRENPRFSYGAVYEKLMFKSDPEHSSFHQYHISRTFVEDICRMRISSTKEDSGPIHKVAPSQLISVHVYSSFINSLTLYLEDFIFLSSLEGVVCSLCSSLRDLDLQHVRNMVSMSALGALQHLMCHGKLECVLLCLENLTYDSNIYLYRLLEIFSGQKVCSIETPGGIAVSDEQSITGSLFSAVSDGDDIDDEESDLYRFISPFAFPEKFGFHFPEGEVDLFDEACLSFNQQGMSRRGQFGFSQDAANACKEIHFSSQTNHSSNTEGKLESGAISFKCTCVDHHSSAANCESRGTSVKSLYIDISRCDPLQVSNLLETLASILPDFRQLTKLGVSLNGSTYTEDVSSLMSQIGTLLQEGRLSHLDLRNIGLQSELVRALANRDKGLEKHEHPSQPLQFLNLTREMSPVQLLSPTMGPALALTHLISNDLSDAYLDNLDRLVKVNLATLSYVSFSNINLDFSPAGHFLAALTSSKVLRTVCLSSMVLDPGMEGVADLLNSVASLQILVLDNCYSQEELAGENFINAVSTHENLQILSMNGVILSHSGAELLRKILTQFGPAASSCKCKLECLNLNDCGILGSSLVASASSLTQGSERCRDEYCQTRPSRQLGFVSLLENPVRRKDIEKLEVLLQPFVRELEMMPVYLQEEHVALM